MAQDNVKALARIRRVSDHVLAAEAVAAKPAENVNVISSVDRIDQSLCGVPVLIENGRAVVELVPDSRMNADNRGLTYGGFHFGMAGYAAVLAINHPHVVLGDAQVRFLRPVRVGDALVCEAKVLQGGDTNLNRAIKKIVDVSIRCRAGGEGAPKRQEAEVFRGRFECFVLEKHVFDVEH
eukprot:TRINITY_DN6516_c0_g1_i1.p1 TRINITY_DN6516_c0_g1~~TRINITY_DN6516_c0_g1_i1.p1  ORF type:complete len:209 (+),score=35.87 TRINITY_DN6516_c0_g1_i1:90-629(+)